MAPDPDHPVQGGRGCSSRQKPYFSLKDRWSKRRRKKQPSVILSSVWTGPSGAPEGAAALGITPREPRRRLRRQAWSSHAHPHTPGLSQHWCNAVIICNHLRRGPKFCPSIRREVCGEDVAADGGSLPFSERIPLLWSSCTWAFHSREETRRTSSQVHSRPQNRSPLSSRVLLVWRLTWPPSLSPSLPLRFPPVAVSTLVRQRSF